MDFPNYVLDTKEKVDSGVLDILTAWKEELGVVTPSLVPLADAFIESSKGGKRIRGALVRLGYELAGGKDSEAIIKSAVAVEIFQTAILAHDDIIDKSLQRRGKASLYQALGGDHYGISQTISLGDWGFFKAVELLTRVDVQVEIKNKAVAFFCKTMLTTMTGEMLDVYLPSQHTYSENDIITLSRLKTASYTFIATLGLGAILAGADQPLVARIEAFALQLGIAYQLHDDLLGVFADEKVLGKSTSSDIEEGKVTLLIAYAREHASGGQTKILDSLYGKEGLTDEEADQVRDIFRQTGADDYVRQKVLQYTHSARLLIADLSGDKSQRDLLDSLTDYLLERQK